MTPNPTPIVQSAVEQHVANVSRYVDPRRHYRHYHACLDAVRVEFDAHTAHLLLVVSRCPSQHKPDPPPVAQLAAARRLTSGYLRHGYVKHARDRLRAAADVRRSLA